MASAFKNAVEELYDLSLYHAALFIAGLAVTMAPQKSLKPAGTCAEYLYVHYELVVRLTFLFVFATFCTAAVTGHVKRRVPDAGLQGVATARARALLCLHAALGWVLSAAASSLSVAACTFLVQAKTGLWQCLPTPVRSGIVVTYVVVAYVGSVVYYHTGRAILVSH